MMYHHYNSSKQEEINKLRKELYGDENQLGSARNQLM